MFARLLGYALAAFMAFMGVQKFIGGVPIFQIIEANADTQWGLQLPWIEPWFRNFTGALELLAALLLVFGRRLQGGALALFIILGAIAAHLTVLGVSTPMSGEPGAPESPTLFYMALGALALTAAVLLLARPKTS